jgi:hypothetical protein
MYRRKSHAKFTSLIHEKEEQESKKEKKKT